MNRSRSQEIAIDFIGKMNPDMWNGEGERPDTFSTLIVSYDINSRNGNELDISFEYDKESKTWEHYCEL